MDLSKLSMTHKGYLNAVLDHIEKVSVFTRDNFDKSANDAENPLLTITLQTNRNYYFSFKMQGAKADVSYVPTAHSNVQPGGGIVTGSNIINGILDHAKTWVLVIEGNQREDAKLAAKQVKVVFANGEMHRVELPRKPYPPPRTPVPEPTTGPPSTHQVAEKLVKVDHVPLTKSRWWHLTEDEGRKYILYPFLVGLALLLLTLFLTELFKVQ